MGILSNKIKIALIILVMVFMEIGIDQQVHKSHHIKKDLFWDVVPDKTCSYIYAPGLFGSEFIMSRYCPEFVASTGEKIYCTKGGHVIGEPHSAVIFDDVNLNKPTRFTWNPATATINSLRNGLFPFAERFFNQKYGISYVDNPKSKLTVVNYIPKLASSDIGQNKDLRSLAKAYKHHLKKHPGLDIILYGDSRGAATTFNFIALYQPKQVKAAILEGIFDTVPHCVKHFLSDHKLKPTELSLHYLVSVLTWRYRSDGITPLQSAQVIEDHVPLLLVTSLKDGLVPSQCAFNLYKILRARGHKQVHLLVLKDSLHPVYMIDDLQDKIDYETVVHAFYQNYNLPYNSSKATQGHKLFLETQPSVQELDDLYPVFSCDLCLR